jgi:hypothetical protein
MEIQSISKDNLFALLKSLERDYSVLVPVKKMRPNSMSLSPASFRKRIWGKTEPRLPLGR